MPALIKPIPIGVPAPTAPVNTAPAAPPVNQGGASIGNQASVQAVRDATANTPIYYDTNFGAGNWTQVDPAFSLPADANAFSVPLAGGTSLNLTAGTPSWLPASSIKSPSAYQTNGQVYTSTNGDTTTAYQLVNGVLVNLGNQVVTHNSGGGVLGAIGGAVGGLLNSAGNAVSGVVQPISDAVSNVTQPIVSAVNDVTQPISTAITNGVNDVGNGVANAANGAYQGVSDAVHDVSAAVAQNPALAAAAAAALNAAGVPIDPATLATVLGANRTAQDGNLVAGVRTGITSYAINSGVNKVLGPSSSINADAGVSGTTNGVAASATDAGTSGAVNAANLVNNIGADPTLATNAALAESAANTAGYGASSAGAGLDAAGQIATSANGVAGLIGMNSGLAANAVNSGAAGAAIDLARGGNLESAAKAGVTSAGLSAVGGWASQTAKDLVPTGMISDAGLKALGTTAAGAGAGVASSVISGGNIVDGLVKGAGSGAAAAAGGYVGDTVKGLTGSNTLAGAAGGATNAALTGKDIIRGAVVGAIDGGTGVQGLGNVALTVGGWSSAGKQDPATAPTNTSSANTSTPVSSTPQSTQDFFNLADGTFGMNLEAWGKAVRAASAKRHQLA